MTNTAILNLTQHFATAEQIAEGVVEPNHINDKKEIKTLLTFEDVPTAEIMLERAHALYAIVCLQGYDRVMIAGPNWFIPVLEDILTRNGIEVKFSFSKRIVIAEKHLPDGRVEKVTDYKHVSWAPNSKDMERYYEAQL